MKIALIALASITGLAFMLPANPLADTKWKTDDFSFHFTKSDTVRISGTAGLEMECIYTVKDSVLSWRDIQKGGPACDPDIIGTYIFKIDNNKLSFRLVNDECDGRKNELENMLLTRE